MKHLSKIVFFFIYVSTLISFISCSEENIKETSIPFWRVHKKISLIEYPQLQETSIPVTIKNAGYKQHDIYVVRWDDNYLSAFDATCTNHGDDYTHKITYTKGDLFYKCNDCGTKFKTMNGISIEKNTANKLDNIKNLQSYNCRFIDEYTIIINNYK